MRIAIMQPYFIPYAGYFRLFCASDLFVIFDCVQFIRRGWIHRNRLLNANGDLQWLTLPLEKAPQHVLIRDLKFAENYDKIWIERLRQFPQLSVKNNNNTLLSTVKNLTASPLNYLTTTLRKTCELLTLPFNITHSASLNLPESLRGEERIIEIARYFGAKEYINLSGGRDLYNHDTFKRHNLKLQFLSDYQGTFESILEKLLKNDGMALRNDIIKQAKLTN